VSGDAPAADLDRLRRDLLRFLRIRERSVQETVTYLRRRGHAPPQIDAAVGEACGRGFLNDERFARLFLRDRRRLRPMSRRAVRLELARRGVDEAVVETALAECDPPWDDPQLAWEAAERRWSRWPEDTRDRRAIGFLQRRGFSPDVIRSVVGRLGEEAQAGP